MTGSKRGSLRLFQTSRRTWRGQSLVELLVAAGIFIITSSSILSAFFGGRSLSLDSHDAALATDYAQEGLEAARLLRDLDWNNLTDGTHGATLSGSDWEFSGASDTNGKFTREITVSPLSANSKRVLSQVTWQALPLRTLTVTVPTILTNWEATQEDNFIEGDWTNPQSAGTGDVDSGAQGTDLLVENGIVFLSSQASLSEKPDLTVFDVSDSQAPGKLSSVDLGVSHISSIAKSGNYVFGSIETGSLDEFMVVDVSNLSAPTKVHSVNFSNGKSKKLAVSGTTLYVGMEQIAGESEFFVFDVSNPLSPQQLGSFEVGATILSIDIFNNKAYLASAGDTEEMIILDVSNPSAITKLGSYNAAGTTDATSISVKDEFNVYLGRSQSSDPEFYILNASNPAAITVKGSADMPATVNDMVAVNILAFTVTEQPNAEFRVLEISDPSNINIAYGLLNFPQNARAVDYENNTIYTAVRSNSALRIVESGP